MTLNELLESKSLTLDLKEKSSLGAKIAAKFRSTKTRPERKQITEGEFTFNVNDYPADWMETKGLRVVENHLKLKNKVLI